jgi:hypothetical protein
MQGAKANSAILIGAIAALALVLSAATIIRLPRPAMANPAMAKSTGKPCAACHTTPPELNDYGRKFRDSQNK